MEKIDKIKPFQKKIDLIAKVIEKTPIREVISKLDESKHNVCEAILGDDTGTIYLTLWDGTIEKIEVNKTYYFTNLFSSEFKKSVRLNIGRFGDFKEADNDLSVNLNNFVSEE
jgi:ssDNA-binding replication factor A large subunit